MILLETYRKASHPLDEKIRVEGLKFKPFIFPHNKADAVAPLLEHSLAPRYPWVIKLGCSAGHTAPPPISLCHSPPS